MISPRYAACVGKHEDTMATAVPYEMSGVRQDRKTFRREDLPGMSPEASRGNSALVYEMWEKDTGGRRILQRLPSETAYV